MSLIPMCRQAMLMLTLTLQLSLAAQQKVSHSPLRCSGNIPADFLELSSKKVMNDREKIAQQDISRNARKIENNFALNSNFGVDEILFSGKVLYGDVLSTYINKVADKILEQDQQLRSELRFYVLKTSSVNAFSTSQGIIFVSVGLISQMENEAQLAFILCHEISHYVKRHNLESYKRRNDIIQGKGSFKQLNFDDRVKEVFSYSKDNELEADRDGLAMFLKTPYNTAAAVSSFDMLLYAYLPYDEIEWTPRELQDSFYKFPSGYTPSKGKEISADEDEDDEESTHPNIRKRKTELDNQLDKKDIKDHKANFLLGTDYFNFIQQQSRVELFYILLNVAQYEKAYYLSYLYKKNYNDTAFASKIAAYCLYGKSTKALSEKENAKLDVSDKNSGIKEEGAYYYVAYFFDRINDKELAVLSVRTAWEAYEKNRQDTFSRTIFEASARNLFKYTDYSLSRFYETIDTVPDVEIIEDSAQKTGALSKVEKLKEKKKKQTKTDLPADGTKDYSRYAFIDDFNDAFFRKTLQEAHSMYKDKEEEEEAYYSSRKEKRWHKKFGYTGNIDSLILINPSFSRISVGKRNKRNLLYDEKQEVSLASKYVEMARLNDLYVDPLNLLDKQNLTTEKINEYSQIMEWLSERLYNFSSDIRLSNSQFISEVIKSKGMSNVCLSSMTYVVTSKGEFEYLMLVPTLFFPPVLPLYLAYYLHKSHDFLMTNVIFDLSTGKLAYLNMTAVKMKYEKEDYLNNQIYSFFNQIKKKNR